MISPSRTRLSYRDRKSHQKKRFRFVGVLLLLIVFYFVLTILGAEPIKMDATTLEPTLSSDSRLLVHRYLIRSPSEGLFFKPNRGELICLHPPYMENQRLLLRLVDPVLRFVTFQRVSILGTKDYPWGTPLVLKRIIAVPGDEVVVNDGVAYVKTPDSAFFLSEFETGRRAYDITALDIPTSWSAQWPLSGEMEAITLGPQEYFVLGDDRSVSNDSRTWGPVPEDRFYGKVFLTYWPLSDFGRP